MTPLILRYFHRSLNVPKLVDVKFTYVPRSMTLARMIRQFKLPSSPHLSRSGLREMEERDVTEVADRFTKYMKRFDMVPEMTQDEVRHQFLSGRGKGEKDPVTRRREGQVIWTYVVEVGPLSCQLGQSYLSTCLFPLVSANRTPRRTRSRISSHSIHSRRRS